MPADDARPSRTALALAALLLAAGLTAGCLSDDDGTEAEAAAGDCEARSTSDARSSGAQVSCLDAAGAGHLQQTFPCENPDQGGYSLAADVEAGGFTVAVRDPTGATVVEETYERTGAFNDSGSLEEGSAGHWTVHVERHEDFEGGFGVHVACAN